MDRQPGPEAAPALWRDLGAGLCVAGLLVPEAVAYAGLAHVPVTHALSAALVGLALYAIFGGSRFAVVAPTSSTATLAAAAVLSLSGPGTLIDPAAYLQAFAALVLLTGLMLMALGAARQGQLSAFVSRPVLRGFAFALAITIVVKQLPDALGLKLPPASGADPLQVLFQVFAQQAAWQLPSLMLAVLCGGLLALLRRWPQLPASLLVMVLSIAAAQALDLQSLGVQEIGSLVAPAFRPALPLLPLQDWLRLGELAFGMVVLVFAESWGSIRTMALTHGDAVDPNRELLVLGACNAGSALLQGMAVGAGFSATSANAAAGAVSRMAGATALLGMLLAVAFALPALQHLPRPVLAVAVIAALWHSLSPAPLLAVWRMKRDRLALTGAVAAVLFFGVLDGMLLAIALSIVEALRRFSRPLVHELAELGQTRNFVIREAHPEARVQPGLLIMRPEEPLFFASAERVCAAIIALAAQRSGVSVVVVSLEESVDLDSTAVECLRELDQRLQKAGQWLLLARVKESVRELLTQCDPQQLGQPSRLFWSVADAVQAAGLSQPVEQQVQP